MQLLWTSSCLGDMSCLCHVLIDLVDNDKKVASCPLVVNSK